MYRAVPQSRPSLPRAVCDTEQSTESVMLCPRELTGGNSPRYTTQPRKTKMDRVLLKYSFAVARWFNQRPQSVERPAVAGMRFTERRD
jgi:hypothetical protein